MSTRAIRGLCLATSRLASEGLAVGPITSISSCSRIECKALATCQASSTTRTGTTFKTSAPDSLLCGSPVRGIWVPSSKHHNQHAALLSAHPVSDESLHYYQ